MSGNKKSDKYAQYLTSVHLKWVTPDETIRGIVKDGTGVALASKQRIIAGEANEVYDITLANNQHVILRISKSGYPNFLQEKWAIEKVQKLGVPVPVILLIKHFKIDDEEKSACLMEKVNGEPLERGSIDFNSLDLNLRRNLINQAGEILSKIHSIKTEGFGWIIGEGKPEFKTSDDLINRLMDKRDEFLQTAAEEDVDIVFVKKALDIIENFRDIYSKVKPYLNHGDYSHKHFMVKNDKLVAILDWGRS